MEKLDGKDASAMRFWRLIRAGTMTRQPLSASRRAYCDSLAIPGANPTSYSGIWLQSGWPAFGDVNGKGLLLVPTTGKPISDIVAIPRTPRIWASRFCFGSIDLAHRRTYCRSRRDSRICDAASLVILSSIARAANRTKPLNWRSTHASNHIIS
jgi:hypothetical protein